MMIVKYMIIQLIMILLNPRNWFHRSNEISNFISIELRHQFISQFSLVIAAISSGGSRI